MGIIKEFFRKVYRNSRHSLVNDVNKPVKLKPNIQPKSQKIKIKKTPFINSKTGEYDISQLDMKQLDNWFFNKLKENK